MISPLPSCRRAASLRTNGCPWRWGASSEGNRVFLIPGFLEALSLISFGDKVVVFIPSNLAYGEKGAGGVIPPNSKLIFELEMFEKNPAEAKQ